MAKTYGLPFPDRHLISALTMGSRGPSSSRTRRRLAAAVPRATGQGTQVGSHSGLETARYAWFVASFSAYSPVTRYTTRRATETAWSAYRSRYRPTSVMSIAASTP